MKNKTTIRNDLHPCWVNQQTGHSCLKLDLQAHSYYNSLQLSEIAIRIFLPFPLPVFPPHSIYRNASEIRSNYPPPLRALSHLVIQSPATATANRLQLQRNAYINGCSLCAQQHNSHCNIKWELGLSTRRISEFDEQRLGKMKQKCKVGRTVVRWYA